MFFRLNDNKVEEQMQQNNEMCHQKENQLREQITVIFRKKRLFQISATI